MFVNKIFCRQNWQVFNWLICLIVAVCLEIFLHYSWPHFLFYYSLNCVFISVLYKLFLKCHAFLGVKVIHTFKSIKRKFKSLKKNCIAWDLNPGPAALNSRRPCSSVASACARETRGPGFKSQPMQFFFRHYKSNF